MRFCFVMLMAVFSLWSCKKQEKIGLFTTKADKELVVDLAEIETSGELIAATFSGPDTYYEYRGHPVGIQYLLVERFANTNGLRLRIEVCNDTLDLINMIKQSKADIIALELPLSFIASCGLTPAGAKSGLGSWAIRSTAPHLCDALNNWYSDDIRKQVMRQIDDVRHNRFKQHTTYSVFRSRANGIVSNYDQLFLQASRICGWDWKLLASMCYQESGFDPNAVSWAGARGLMQIMPSTARGIGVEPNMLFDPQVNMKLSARLIKQLDGKFKNVINPNERKKFVLASYNGGIGHVVDAMNLARKHGYNPYLWSDVSTFLLRLSQPSFYKDPVVKCGYMVGTETYNYVNSIMERWQGYHAVLRNTLPRPSLSGIHSTIHKPDRFSTQQNIISREDSIVAIKR